MARLRYVGALLLLVPVTSVALYACSGSKESGPGEETEETDDPSNVEADDASALADLSDAQFESLCLELNDTEEEIVPTCEYTAVLVARDEATDQASFRSLCISSRDACVDATEPGPICEQDIIFAETCTMTAGEFRTCRADSLEAYRAWGNCEMTLEAARAADFVELLPCAERHLACLETQ